jgi:hypothetical protein
MQGKRILPFLFTRRKPGWLAIIPQGGWVTLAHVLRDPNGRPEVRLLDSFALDHGGVREALQHLRVARQLKSYVCTTLMGEGEYTVSQLDAPPVPAEERKEALRWGAQGNGELSGRYRLHRGARYSESGLAARAGGERSGGLPPPSRQCVHVSRCLRKPG